MQVVERQAGDVATLTRLARASTKAIQRDRYRAVLLALAGQEAVAIAAALGRARRSVQDWVYAYRDGGVDALVPGRATGRPTKLPRAREAGFPARLDAGPRDADGVCTLRGKDIVRILEEEFGATYTLNGAYGLPDRLGFSCLSPRPRHEKNDPRAVADFKAHAPLLSGR